MNVCIVVLNNQIFNSYWSRNITCNVIFLKRSKLSVWSTLKLIDKHLQVLHVELTAIKRGCAMAAPSATIGITLVVVQKRHHTRFFPHKKDGDGRNNNVPAGTLVDTVITHPTEIDFYLVSHQSIQVGT